MGANFPSLWRACQWHRPRSGVCRLTLRGWKRGSGVFRYGLPRNPQITGTAKVGHNHNIQEFELMKWTVSEMTLGIFQIPLSHCSEYEVYIGSAFAESKGLLPSIDSLWLIMSWFSSRVLKSALVACTFSALRASAAPTVQVLNGTYVGTYSPEYNQDFFLGMPYSQPPVEDLRFRTPQSLNTSWTGTKNATEYSPECYGYGVSTWKRYIFFETRTNQCFTERYMESWQYCL